MAKGLETLIKINEWTVDERRRELGRLLQELEELDAGLIGLGEELMHEQREAAAYPETAGFLYGYYADAVIDRRTKLQDLIKSKEEEIITARESLREAYQELKKYEVVDDNQRRRAAEKLARKNQAELDELGLYSSCFRADL